MELVETALDLISAHNHVMAKYGFETKIRGYKKLVGKGANSLITRSSGDRLKKILKELMIRCLKEMVNEFLDYYKKTFALIARL